MKYHQLFNQTCNCFNPANKKNINNIRTNKYNLLFNNNINCHKETYKNFNLQKKINTTENNNAINIIPANYTPRKYNNFSYNKYNNTVNKITNSNNNINNIHSHNNKQITDLYDEINLIKIKMGCALLNQKINRLEKIVNNINYRSLNVSKSNDRKEKISKTNNYIFNNYCIPYKNTNKIKSFIKDINIGIFDNYFLNNENKNIENKNQNNYIETQIKQNNSDFGVLNNPKKIVKIYNLKIKRENNLNYLGRHINNSKKISLKDESAQISIRIEDNEKKENKKNQEIKTNKENKENEENEKHIQNKNNNNENDENNENKKNNLNYENNKKTFNKIKSMFDETESDKNSEVDVDNDEIQDLNDDNLDKKNNNSLEKNNSDLKENEDSEEDKLFALIEQKANEINNDTNNLNDFAEKTSKIENNNKIGNEELAHTRTNINKMKIIKFDEKENIIIKYNQNSLATRLLIYDMKGKRIPFKPKKIKNYYNKLRNKNYKLKPNLKESRILKEEAITMDKLNEMIDEYVKSKKKEKQIKNKIDSKSNNAVQNLRKYFQENESSDDDDNKK